MDQIVAGYSQADALNNAGQVVGTTNATGAPGGRAFLWTATGGRQDLGVLSGGTWSIALGINDGGTVVGYGDVPGGHHAFAWTAATGIVDLGTTPGNQYSRAVGINNLGQIVGDSGPTDVGNPMGQAALWSATHQMTDLGTLPGIEYSVAGGINDDGQVVGSSWNGNHDDQQAFVWSMATGMQELPALNGDTTSFAEGINANGEIVGVSGNPSDQRAVLWAADGTVTDLNMLIPNDSGWTLQEATGVNGHGQIVGNGLLSGQAHGFLLTPVPAATPTSIPSPVTPTPSATTTPIASLTPNQLRIAAAVREYRQRTDDAMASLRDETTSLGQEGDYFREQLAHEKASAIVDLASEVLALLPWEKALSPLYAQLSAKAATGAAGVRSVSYPWYQWSPDGKYLLLVHSQETGWAIQVLKVRSGAVQTLAQGLPAASFYPSWAMDGDRIAYAAAISPTTTATGLPANRITVRQVDIHGSVRPFWSYTVGGGGGMEGGGAGCDPNMSADQQYWRETGPQGVAPTLQWSIARHIAIYSMSPFGGINATDTGTGTTWTLGHPSYLAWIEARLSSSGKLAAVVGVPDDGPTRVVITAPHPGAAVRTVAPGELPVWSRDGRYLYFVQRRKGAIIHQSCPGSGTVPVQTYTSTIWRADADGSHLVRLMSEDAYALGPLQLTPDGAALIFSRISNPIGGATVQVQRLDTGGAVTTLARDADRPAV